MDLKLTDPNIDSARLLESLKPVYLEIARRRFLLRRVAGLTMAACALASWSLVTYFNAAVDGSRAAPKTMVLALAPLLVGLMVTRIMGRRFKLGYTSRTFVAASVAAWPLLRVDRLGGLPPQILRTSHLFDRAASRYSSECLFTGDVQGVPIGFALVTADASGPKGPQPLFRGVIFQAEFSTSVASPMLICMPRSTPPSLVRGKIRVAMGELTTGLGIFAADESEARNVVTPLMALHLDELARMLRDRSIRVSFVGNRMTIAVTQTNALMRPRLWDFGSDLDTILGVAEQMRGFARIVMALRRNPHLWSKSA